MGHVHRQVRKRKWDNYTSGEELFGLPVTQYPELALTERQLGDLDRLYRYVESNIVTVQAHSAAKVFIFCQNLRH